MRVVLPGDFITDNFNVASTQAPKIIGYGLEKRKDGVYAMVAGILNETDNKIWLVTSTKRYTPHSGDRVLGAVVSKSTDYFRVDIGAADLAMLSFMSFEGATKRNRPKVKVGDLLYGQVILTSKHLEPEVSFFYDDSQIIRISFNKLSCIDSETRSRGMGVIATPGLVFPVSLNYARKLLSPNEGIVSALGKQIKFEITVGVNGKVWIGGEHAVVLAVRNALIEGETTFESNLPYLVKNTVQKIESMRRSAENNNEEKPMDVS